MSKLRLALAIIVPVTAGVILGVMALVGPVSNQIEQMQYYAVAHDLTPEPNTVACKTAKSCYQSQLQKQFQAKQKADMKAFQQQQKADMKAKYRPKQTLISRSRDLSANQKKAMLKELAAQQKAEMKSQMADFKAQQKAQRDAEKAIIKAMVKAAYG